MSLWNFTIDDTSPYLSYSPLVDGPSGWRTWYSQSQYNVVPDEVGRGDSSHIASWNTSVTFCFYGSGISLFGNANGTFNVVVDNILRASVNSTPTSLLYSLHDLIEGLHSVTLNALHSTLDSSLISFDFAVASSPINANENPPSPLFYDNSDTDSFSYSGAWSTNNANGIPNSTISAPFHATTESGASVSLSFTGGTAIAVRGMIDSESGLYSVTLNGSTSIFNGSSVWTIPDALLFFRAGLDPGATHVINITNMNAGTKLCLNSMTLFQREPKVPSIPSPTTSLTSSGVVNIGVIIGPIVALVILLIIGACILCHRRHRHRRIKPWRLDPFRQSTSGAREISSPILWNRARPSLLSNIKTHFSSSAISPGVINHPNSSSEESSKPPTYVLMSRSSPSPAKPLHSNAAPVEDQMNPRHATSLGETSHPAHPDTSVPTPDPPRRRPLPTIPVPPYYVASQTSDPSAETKRVGDLFGGRVRPKTQETAPPQYER